VSHDLSDLWSAVMDLAKRDGVIPLNALPALWERKVDSEWYIACNGHKEPMETTLTPTPIRVLPFHLYVEFNGWPAGVMTAYGGQVCAGTEANMDTLVEAVRASCLPARAEVGR